MPNKQIDELLKPYTDAYFAENDASTIESEFKKANKWRKQELAELKSQLATLIKGIVPEGKSIDVDDYSDSHEYAGAVGFNWCRQLILENIASLFKEEVSDE